MRNEIINLMELPLKSFYRALIFYGRADGTDMSLGFDLGALQGRTIVIKSVRLFPYAFEAMQDFFVSDGTVTNEETIPALARINRVFGDYDDTAIINIIINGSPIGIFPSDAKSGYPADLYVDNIYYHFKEKVQTFVVNVDVDVFIDLEAGTTGNPNMKVLVECYIL